VSRTAIRRALVLSGLALVAGPLLAPGPLARMIPAASAAWYLALAVFAVSAFTVLRAWLGRWAAGTLVGLGLASPILLTALPFPPALALKLPCPRNWGWMPTWQLRPSPMGSLVFQVDSARVKICYGRPAARGRRMIGGRRVPFGQLWRTGANEPTTIISPVPLEVAEVPVPAGRVSLYTIPGPESWELILNSATGQWGIESEYTEAVRAHELGRVIVPSVRDPAAARVERLTITAAPRPDGSADMILAWEGTMVPIPVRRAPR
jgi:hypothetical protein